MQLNEDQQKAIEQTGHTVVIAGPGTGKTATLVAKVVRLLEGGSKQKEIIVLTFTRKAAEEMYHRIQKETGRKETELPFIGTIHSWGLELLKENSGFGEKRFILEEEHKGVIKNLLQNYNLNSNKQLLTEIGLVRIGAKRGVREEIYALVEEYEQWLKKENAWDFDGILIEVEKLVKDVFPEQLKLLKHVVVDEFQDLNIIQQKIVRHILQGSGASIFAVGDPKQGIYGFRGAVVEGMENLCKELHTIPIYLQTNYRSDQKILDVSTLLFRGENLKLQSYASKKNANVCRLFTDSDKTEAYWLAHEVMRLTGADNNFRISVSDYITNNPIGLSDILICYRSYQFSTLAAKEFSRYSIPFTLTGEKKFGEFEDVKLIWNILNAILKKEIPFDWQQKQISLTAK